MVAEREIQEESFGTNGGRLCRDAKVDGVWRKEGPGLQSGGSGTRVGKRGDGETTTGERHVGSPEYGRSEVERMEGWRKSGKEGTRHCGCELIVKTINDRVGRSVGMSRGCCGLGYQCPGASDGGVETWVPRRG